VLTGNQVYFVSEILKCFATGRYGSKFPKIALLQQQLSNSYNRRPVVVCIAAAGLGALLEG